MSSDELGRQVLALLQLDGFGRRRFSLGEVTALDDACRSRQHPRCNCQTAGFKSLQLTCVGIGQNLVPWRVDDVLARISGVQEVEVWNRSPRQVL
jgi:hypothetical protein